MISPNLGHQPPQNNYVCRPNNYVANSFVFLDNLCYLTNEDISTS